MPSEIEQSQSRFAVSEETDGLRISIPPKRDFFVVFYGLWLCGWTAGGIAAGASLFRHFSFFVMFWLVAWAIGEIVVGYVVLYAIGGREIIVVTPDTVIRRTEIFGLGTARTYDVHEMRNLRRHAKQGPVRGRKASSVAFDYAGRFVGFGVELDDAEAAELISWIWRKCAIPNSSKP